MSMILAALKKVFCKPCSCLSLTALLFSVFGFAGCSGLGTNLEGHWVDVNGPTTLDISGNTMVMRAGDWSQTYRIKVEDIEGVAFIQNTDPEAPYFFSMQDIKIDEDGSLSSRDMVLDAPGHYYRFVREENLPAELEIKDLSKDLPKEINSEELQTFSLVFTNQYGSYGLDPQWPQGAYSWEITREGDTCKMKFRITGPSYIVLDFSETVSEKYVAGLAKLLKKQNLPQLNGYYHKNNVDRPGYYLSACYTSKEKLTIRAEGTAADTCVFDLAPLLEYAAKQKLPLKDK